MRDGDIPIDDELTIPAAEVSYRTSRSGGPGGQHVNTSSTRVELVWDLAGSAAVTPEQSERIRVKLANRINTEGQLAVSDASTRSQHRNREAAVERFASLLRAALAEEKPRRPTRPPRSAKEERLKAKKRRSEAKRLRRTPVDE